MLGDDTCHSLTGITSSCPRIPGDSQTQDSCISLRKETDLTWSCKESDLWFTCFSCCQMRPAVWKHGHLRLLLWSQDGNYLPLGQIKRPRPCLKQLPDIFLHLLNLGVSKPSCTSSSPLGCNCRASGWEWDEPVLSSITAKAGRNIQTSYHSTKGSNDICVQESDVTPCSRADLTTYHLVMPDPGSQNTGETESCDSIIQYCHLIPPLDHYKKPTSLDDRSPEHLLPAKPDSLRCF